MFDAKKKLIVIAIAGAFALPLAAQAQSSVTVYGKLYPQITSYSITGASALGTAGNSLRAPIPAGSQVANVSGTVMEASNSRLGFRGTEDLGGGLRVLFQLETTVAVDSGATGSATAFFNRDTFVGLSGGFGTVSFGIMDTAYKMLGDNLSFLGIGSGNFVSLSNILSEPTFGSSATTRFHQRPPNTIYYASPKVGGFEGQFSHSLGEAPSSAQQNSITSAGVRYAQGPISVALAHEIHNNRFGLSRFATANRNGTGGTGGTFVPNEGASSKDRATRLTVDYRFTPSTRAQANLARLGYNETGGAVGRLAGYRTTTWSLGVDHKLSTAVTLAASYGQAGDGVCSLVGGAACSTAGLNGKMLNLGGSYALSKRTWLFAIASQMTNGSSAVGNNSGGNIPAPSGGADIRQVAFGINHNF